MHQLPLFETGQFKANDGAVKPFKLQLLKWIGNKQRFAHEIISFFPEKFGTYFEPFLGSGGVLATLAPPQAVASDAFQPLIQIFQTLQTSPETVKTWYAENWHFYTGGAKKERYEAIKASYNRDPNPKDLLFISRSCYGGVIRFRKDDGYISTPVGVHTPIAPESFARRVDAWRQRLQGTQFYHRDYGQAMRLAKPGDLIYCDPPYSHSQAILYGAQSFDVADLFDRIGDCKERGVNVVLSLDGSKKSGNMICDLPIPDGLFEREVFVNVGRSMLKRFQMNGQTLEKHGVKDRLLLTY